VCILATSAESAGVVFVYNRYINLKNRKKEENYGAYDD